MSITKAITEITILFIVIYLLLRALHGTRGETIIRGYLIVFVIMFATTLLLTKIFHLRRVEYLLNHFLSIYLFGLVIIFQPELRAGLIRLGKNPFVKGLYEKQLKVMEEIIESIEFLAKRKVGAIIVLERSVKLGNIIATGVNMDAEVSKALLITIFWPGSPLHDGAVVIRDQRIIASLCLLPLTEKENLSYILGTRHRAAIGVSEDSDCVALVVSEERGTISIAMDGKLKEDVTPSEVREIVTKIFGEMALPDQNGTVPPTN